MTCEKCQILLDKYTETGLSPEEQRRLIEHIDTCSGCRLEFIVATNLKRSDLRLDVKPPSEDFTRKVMARVTRHSLASSKISRVPARNRVILYAAAAAAAVIISVVVFLALSAGRPAGNDTAGVQAEAEKPAPEPEKKKSEDVVAKVRKGPAGDNEAAPPENVKTVDEEVREGKIEEEVKPVAPGKRQEIETESGSFEVANEPERPEEPEKTEHEAVVENASEPKAPAPAPALPREDDSRGASPARFAVHVLPGGTLKYQEKTDGEQVKISGYAELAKESRLETAASRRAAIEFDGKESAVLFDRNTEIGISSFLASRIELELLKGKIIIDTGDGSREINVHAGDYSVRVNRAVAQVTYSEKSGKITVLCLANSLSPATEDSSVELLDFQATTGRKMKFSRPANVKVGRTLKWALKLRPSLEKKLNEAARRAMERIKADLAKKEKEEQEKNTGGTIMLPPNPQNPQGGQAGGGINQGGSRPANQPNQPTPPPPGGGGGTTKPASAPK